VKSDSKMRPMCRHCYAWIEVQHRIDEKIKILNPDGSPHRCHGTETSITTIGSISVSKELPPHPDDVRPAVRNTDPETSHEAWDGAKEGAATLRLRIVAYLLDQKERGATISEIADALGYKGARDSVSPRMKELSELGLVYRGPSKRVPGPGLRLQSVWVHDSFYTYPGA